MGLFGFARAGKKDGNPIKAVDSMIKDVMKSSRIDRKAVKSIADYIKEREIDYPFPKDLLEYMRNERDTDKIEDILEVFIRHKKNLNKDLLELNKAKKLGVKKVKIRTCQDARVCSACKKYANKTFSVNKAPKLPICWDCRCYYEPQI